MMTKKNKVLIAATVEDAFFYGSLVDILESIGFTVREVRTVKELLDATEELQDELALIITFGPLEWHEGEPDDTPPNMFDDYLFTRGWRAVDHLRRNGNVTPVIFIYIFFGEKLSPPKLAVSLALRSSFARRDLMDAVHQLTAQSQ
jgi:hypothetical protein